MFGCCFVEDKRWESLGTPAWGEVKRSKGRGMEEEHYKETGRQEAGRLST